MKAKFTIPKKGERLESPEVEPPKQPVSQANEEDLNIDLSELPQLRIVNNILERLYRTARPNAITCVDEARHAYNTASALLTYADYAEKGLHAESSELSKPIAGYVMDSIQLQLDIMRLAGEHLYSRCRVHDSRESGESRNS